MKKFLSALLAVAMVVAMLPAGIAFAADGDNTDIVFDFKAASQNVTPEQYYPGRSDMSKGFNEDASLAGYMPEGISVNHTIGQTAANLRWQMNSSLRFCNHNSTWEKWTAWSEKDGVFTSVSKGPVATQNNRLALDIAISADQAGWYRPNISFGSWYNGALYSAYVISGAEVKYLGEIDSSTAVLNPVYLGEGTHTLFLGVRHPAVKAAESENGFKIDNESPTTFISNITLKAINKVPTVVAESVTAPATLAVGETGTVDASALAVSDEVGTYDFAIYAADAATGKSLGASTVDYVEVTSSSPYVATVAKTSATTYTITPNHEGEATLTITPVVGGVKQTAMATTKTITVTNEDFRFDFVEWVKEEKPRSFPYTTAEGSTTDINRFLEFTAEQSPKYFAPNRTKTAQTSGVYFEANHLRICNVNTDWQTEPRSGGNAGNNKWAFDITVPAGKEGWYAPSFNMTNAAAGSVLSVYHVFGDKATFLGDWDGAKGATAIKTNAVYLSEGVNTFVIAAIKGPGGQPTYYFNTFEFKKLAAAPTMSAPVVADLPEAIAVDETVSATVTVSMSDSSLYQFPEYAMNMPTNFQSAGKDTENYVEVTSSIDGIVEVTDAKAAGALNKDKPEFTVKGLKSGTTVLTFTPVIAGEKKTDLVTTKTVKVKSWDIKYDFSYQQTIVKEHEDWLEVNRPNKDISKVFSVLPELKDLMPAGIKLSSLNVADSLMRWNNDALRFCSHNALWTSNGENSRLAFDITLDADQAGWYRPNFQSVNGYSAQFYVYAKRADGSIKYLGELSSNGKRLNPVYLGEGTHTLVLGCYNKNGADATNYIKEINLYRYENEPTMSTFTAAIPTAVAYGTTADVKFESATLSDSGRFEYGTYKMLSDGQARFDKDGTSDYMLVESSNTAVATVTRVGADKWTLTPVSDGETTITVTPYYNGVAQTALKQTKTVLVTHPNESVNYTPNFIVDAVVGEEGISTEARELITSEDLAIGAIDDAALGSWVTLTAKSNDTYKFLYWYNGNSKVILSDAEEYKFQVGTKAAIYAKYARADDELVEHATAAGQIVGSLDGETKTKEIGSYYTLIYKEAAAAESTLVEKTATLADFVCWVKEGQIVSYNENYSFYTWGNAVDADEVAEGEESDVPAVVLFKDGNAYMLELVNFEGKTIVEKGILFANGGTPTVDSFGAKAVATTDKAQFTASTDASVARAYVIYLDGGKYRVAYSD